MLVPNDMDFIRKVIEHTYDHLMDHHDLDTIQNPSTQTQDWIIERALVAYLTERNFDVQE